MENNIDMVEVKWNPEWFTEKRLPQQYWNSMENQKRFLNTLATEYHLSNVVDWNRMTGALIKRKGGYVITC